MKTLTESYCYIRQTLYDVNWLKSYYISIFTTEQVTATSAISTAYLL